MSHAHRPGLRASLAAIVSALALILLLPMAAYAHPGKGHGHGHQHHGHHGKGHGHHAGPGIGKTGNVGTRNLYLGADLTPAFSPPPASLEELFTVGGQILREVDENEFPTRAKGLAGEILSQKPDLIGLQEVALWRTGPLNPAVLTEGPSATTVRYDYLQELLGELNKYKPQYEVVVSQDEFDFETPVDADGDPETGFEGAEMNGRLTMRDVILARRGAGVQTANPDAGHFASLLPVPILGSTVPVTRGWVSTDAKVRGSHWFHFVNTHLEAFNAPPPAPNFRALQAAELVAPGGPATSSLPVVLVGDLNSDDDTVGPGNQEAYATLIGAGLVERSTDEPLSCCLQSSLLSVTAAEEAGAGIADFDHQVDHVMTSAPSQITLQSSAVTGLTPVNGFWDSDHAGVFSALRFAH